MQNAGSTHKKQGRSGSGYTLLALKITVNLNYLELRPEFM